jgi:hypothetical protein
MLWNPPTIKPTLLRAVQTCSEEGVLGLLSYEGGQWVQYEMDSSCRQTRRIVSPPAAWRELVSPWEDFLSCPNWEEVQYTDGSWQFRQDGVLRQVPEEGLSEVRKNLGQERWSRPQTISRYNVAIRRWYNTTYPSTTYHRWGFEYRRWHRALVEFGVEAGVGYVPACILYPEPSVGSRGYSDYAAVEPGNDEGGVFEVPEHWIPCLRDRNRGKVTLPVGDPNSKSIPGIFYTRAVLESLGFSPPSPQADRYEHARFCEQLLKELFNQDWADQTFASLTVPTPPPAPSENLPELVALYQSAVEDSIRLSESGMYMTSVSGASFHPIWPGDREQHDPFCQLVTTVYRKMRGVEVIKAERCEVKTVVVSDGSRPLVRFLIEPFRSDWEVTFTAYGVQGKQKITARNL